MAAPQNFCAKKIINDKSTIVIRTNALLPSQEWQPAPAIRIKHDGAGQALMQLALMQVLAESQLIMSRMVAIIHASRRVISTEIFAAILAILN